jgi:hypothetical protein
VLNPFAPLVSFRLYRPHLLPLPLARPPGDAGINTIVRNVAATEAASANTIAGAHTALCLWYPVATCRAPFVIRHPLTTFETAGSSCCGTNSRGSSKVVTGHTL